MTLPPLAKFQLVWRRLCAALLPSSSLVFDIAYINEYTTGICSRGILGSPSISIISLDNHHVSPWVVHQEGIQLRGLYNM